MDLSLTWRGDYVVRAALALARSQDPEAWVKASAVAEATAIPRTYVPQILSILAHAGIVEARAGRLGGYRLTRDAAEVPLLAVVEAGEGPLRSRRCVLRGGPCAMDGHCAIHEPWLAAQQALRERLAATSLADVVEGTMGRRAGAIA